MIHTGKIGRLPKTLRDELGQRLEDNLPGVEILQWLNAQEKTQDILERYFGGRPITEQNLSEWRQFGHQNWLRRREAGETTRIFLEDTWDLGQVTETRDLGNRFAAILAIEMTRLAQELLEPETDPEKKWERLCQIHRELSRLRHDDDRATRTTIQMERREHEAEIWHEEQMARDKKAHKERMMDMLLEKTYKAQNAKLLFGGGENGARAAEMLYRIKCDLPFDDLENESASQTPATPPTPEPPRSMPSTESISPDPAHANPAHPVHPVPSIPPVNPEESNQIQPNPTKSK